MRVLVALTIGLVLGWILEPWLYAAMETRIDKAVLERLKGTDIEYKTVFHSATEPFTLKLKLSFYIALVIILPYIIGQIWGFVAPALKPNEQQPFKRLAPASGILFLVGAGFAYAVVPAMFSWFVSYAGEFKGTSIYQEAGSQLFLVAKMMLAFGVAFQLPLIVYGLGLAGVLTAETLMKYWRHGATAIFAVAAIVTPSNDPMSMLMMAIPLTGLFIGSVYAVKFMEKRRDRDKPTIESPVAVLDPIEPEPLVEQNGADLPESVTEDENSTSG